MGREIRRSLEAREDSLSIWGYIAYGNPLSGDSEAADRVLEAIEKTYRHLVDFPHKTQVENRDLFRVVVDGFPQYLILYRFDDESVEVLRVFRGDLDWNRIADEL